MGGKVNLGKRLYADDRDKCKVYLMSMGMGVHAEKPTTEEITEANAEYLLRQLHCYGWQNVLPALTTLRKRFTRMPTLAEIQWEIGHYAPLEPYELWMAGRVLTECRKMFEKLGIAVEGVGCAHGQS